MEKVFLWISGVLVGAIITMVGGFIKHATNTNKHPKPIDTNKLVFKDVCKSEKKRIEDCIENEIRVSAERYDLMTKSLDRLTDKIESL